MNNESQSESQSALESLWQSLNAELRSFFKRRLPDESLADDLIQETFLRLQAQQQKLDEIERLDSWVFRIARNLLVDYYRNEQRSPTRLTEQKNESQAAETESGENHNQHIGKWLREAIEQLPESLRDAVRMYEIESMSQQTIADKLGVSLSGAKSRIQRGRARLKQLLNQCCSLEMDARRNVVAYRQVGPDCNSACCD